MTLSVMRGGTINGSRRRRPSPRPVRERLERTPRVGPPAATRSSAVIVFGLAFCVRPSALPPSSLARLSALSSLEVCSPSPVFDAPLPRDPRRRRRDAEEVEEAPGWSPTSGRASSRWVSGVSLRGASSSAPTSRVSVEVAEPVDALPERPRPRPPRRRRFLGAPVPSGRSCEAPLRVRRLRRRGARGLRVAAGFRRLGTARRLGLPGLTRGSRSPGLPGRLRFLGLARLARLLVGRFANRRRSLGLHGCATWGSPIRSRRRAYPRPVRVWRCGPILRILRIRSNPDGFEARGPASARPGPWAQVWPWGCGRCWWCWCPPVTSPSERRA